MFIVLAFVAAVLTAVYFYNRLNSMKTRRHRWEGWYTWDERDSKGNVTSEGYGIRSNNGEEICRVAMPREAWPLEVVEYVAWRDTLPKSKDPVVDAEWEVVKED